MCCCSSFAQGIVLHAAQATAAQGVLPTSILWHCLCATSLAGNLSTCERASAACSMSFIPTILGILYILAALPVTYVVVVTSAFEWSAPIQGLGDFASRGLLFVAFLSFPVLMVTAAPLLLHVSSVSSLSDLWPVLLPGFGVVLLAANALIPGRQNAKVN